MKINVLGLVMGLAFLAPAAAQAQAGTANYCVTSRSDGTYTNNCAYVVNLNLIPTNETYGGFGKILQPGESVNVTPDAACIKFACQSPQWAVDLNTNAKPTSKTVRWVCQISK